MPRKYIPRAPMRIIDSVDTRANESTLKQTTQNTTKAQSAEKPTGLSEEQKRDLAKILLIRCVIYKKINRKPKQTSLAFYSESHSFLYGLARETLRLARIF